MPRSPHPSSHPAAPPRRAAPTICRAASTALVLAAGAVALTACGGPAATQQPDPNAPDSILSGLKLPSSTTTEVGVNSVLWRSALQVIGFMPITSADPFAGVILTDWYGPDGSTDERFRINVYILSQTLRADAVRVAAFRQVRTGQGWVDAVASPDLNQRLEDSILFQARELRVIDAAGG